MIPKNDWFLQHHRLAHCSLWRDLRKCSDIYEYFVMFKVHLKSVERRKEILLNLWTKISCTANTEPAHQKYSISPDYLEYLQVSLQVLNSRPISDPNPRSTNHILTTISSLQHRTNQSKTAIKQLVASSTVLITVKISFRAISFKMIIQNCAIRYLRKTKNNKLLRRYSNGTDSDLVHS